LERDLEEAIGRKVLWRLVLPSALFILCGAIDRANVGFAALQMNAALGMSGAAYGFAAGVLFVGYLAAKYPSVLLYEAVGMRRWLAIITLAWGISASSMSLVRGQTDLYILRVIVGCCEGGLSSGLMIYLSGWASERFRASVLAIPIMAISVAQVIGAPISGWLLEMRNPLGIEGWRWMFLMEGLPAVALAVFAWLHYPDTPRQAKWLTGEERDWIARNVQGATRPPKGEANPQRWAALRSPLGWLCAVIWFCILAGNYGIMFWLPQIVRGLAGLTPTETGVVVALPWAGSAIGLYFNARHSDRTQERFLHVAVPALVGAAGLLSAWLLGPGLPGLIALIVGGASIGCTVAAFWAIPTRLLPPEGLAMGIVAINVVGSLAGATIPAAMGFLRDASDSFLPPTLLLVGVQVVLALLCLLAKRMERGMLGPASI
jgi:ACS family tartrate transporter-like MFS transporter